MSNLMLKFVRIGMGVDEKEIADRINITKDKYISIENNSIEPRLHDMIKISNVLGATIDELFG